MIGNSTRRKPPVEIRKYTWSQMLYVVRPNRQVLLLIDCLYVFQVLLLAAGFSQAYTFFPGSRPLFLYPILAINMFFLVVGLIKLNRSSIFMVFVLALILFYSMLFSAHFGTTLTLAKPASFGGIMSIALLGVVAHYRSLDKALSLTATGCVLYLLLFFYLRSTIDPAAIMAANKIGEQTNQSIMAAHGSAGDTFRIRVSVLHIVFGLTYYLANLKQKVSIKSVIFVTAFISTVILSDYRFMMVSAAVVGLAIFFPLPVSAKSKICLFVAALAMVFVLASSSISFNYYHLTAVDKSSSARAEEAELAMAWFSKYPLFGIGQYSESSDIDLLSEGRNLFISDLGLMGELLQYGILGYILLFISFMFMNYFVSGLSRFRYSIISQDILLGSFVFVVMYELTGTFIWAGGGGFILAIMVGYHFSGRRRISYLSKSAP